MAPFLASLLTLVGEVRQQAGEGRLQRALALLTALGALTNGFEAYVEHRRGAYRNRWMWTPIALAPLAGLVAIGGIASPRVARAVLPWSSLILLADGVTGTVLHARGVRRMPGGLKLGTYNISMGPPLFAPLLLGLVGLLGIATALMRRERLGGEERGL